MRRITRLMSKRREDAAKRREAAAKQRIPVPRPRGERTMFTRSMSYNRGPAVVPPGPGQKRKFQLMPLSALIPSDACRERKKFYKEQFELEQPPAPRKPVYIDFSEVKIYHGTMARHTTESRLETLDRIGAIFGNGRPKTQKRSPEEEAEHAWDRTVTVMMGVVLVHAEILHRDAISLLRVSRGIHNVLISMFLPWRSLDFRGMENAGDHLVQAFKLTRYLHVQHINLERAKDIEDKHLKVINAKVLPDVLGHIQSLNLDFCKQISNRGVKDITIICPALKKFSFCDNERVTYFGIRSLVKNCKFLTDLNLSGCKNLTDNSLVAIGKACHELEFLNIARCDQITDDGVIAIAKGCPSLQSLSVFGIPGLTDRCLETLAKFCSNTLTALDVNMCTGIKRRSSEELVQLYPNLRCFDISMDPAMQF